jgi:CRP-like cAMP-binding protein
MEGKVPAESVDRQAALRSSPLLQEFTDVGIRILAKASTRRTVGRGTYAFRAGEPSTELMVIAKGTLLLLAREGGAALGEVTSGDALGGFSLLAGGEHLVSALASTDVELVVLHKSAFETLRKTKPGASLKLLIALANDFAERLREARGPLREFLAWQVSKRQAEKNGSRPGGS